MASASTNRAEDVAGLPRVLGVPSLLFLGVANAIGAGIFVLTGAAAANYAGPGIALSFVLAGAICGFATLAYAELGAMHPQAGASYGYARAAFGADAAWYVGWIMVLEYLFAASTVAAGWSSYLQAMLSDLGVTLPAALTLAPVAWDPTEGLSWSGAVVNLPAVLSVAFCAALLLLGVSRSSRVNNAIVALKVGLILLVIGFGIFYVDATNWRPFVPPNEGQFGVFGWSGVVRASAIAFFSYTGFEVIATAAMEARRPARDLPLALGGALLLIGGLYVGVCLVVTGLTPYPTLDNGAPVVSALRAEPALQWLASLVAPVVVIGLLATIFVSLYGQTRVFYAMAGDGLLPSSMKRISGGAKPPVGVIVSAVVCAALAGLLPIDVLGDMVSVGCLLAFAAVCAALVHLRIKAPEHPRPFRVPFGVVVGCVGVVSYIALVFALPRLAWSAVLIWTLIGAAIHAVRTAAARKRAAAAASSVGP